MWLFRSGWPGTNEQSPYPCLIIFHRIMVLLWVFRSHCDARTKVFHVIPRKAFSPVPALCNSEIETLQWISKAWWEYLCDEVFMLTMQSAISKMGYYRIHQWLSTFLMLQLFNTVPHVIENLPTIKLFSSLLHNCYLLLLWIIVSTSVFFQWSLTTSFENHCSRGIDLVIWLC